MRKMKSKRTHKRIEESDQAVLEARIENILNLVEIGE